MQLRILCYTVLILLGITSAKSHLVDDRVENTTQGTGTEKNETSLLPFNESIDNGTETVKFKRATLPPCVNTQFDLFCTKQIAYRSGVCDYDYAFRRFQCCGSCVATSGGNASNETDPEVVRLSSPPVCTDLAMQDGTTLTAWCKAHVVKRPVAHPFGCGNPAFMITCPLSCGICTRGKRDEWSHGDVIGKPNEIDPTAIEDSSINEECKDRKALDGSSLTEWCQENVIHRNDTDPFGCSSPALKIVCKKSCKVCQPTKRQVTSLVRSILTTTVP